VKNLHKNEGKGAVRGSAEECMNEIDVYRYTYCPVQEATGHLNEGLIINTTNSVTHDTPMTKKEAVHHHHHHHHHHHFID
jgi:hypothetical protein